MKPVETPQKPWHQLGFIIGEAVLSLIANGVMFILISRISGPELLGTYALAFAWMMLFQGVSGFGIPVFLMREVGARGREAAAEVFHSILLGLGSGFLALCLMLAAVHLMGYSADLVQVITVASLAVIPSSLNIACRSVFLAMRQMHFNFLALLVEVTIVVSASVYQLLSGHGALALMITLVVAKFVSASIALALLYGRVLPGRPSFDLDLLFTTARTIFTFGIGSMLGMLTMRINTIMVSVWVDITTVGHFAAATKIMEIGLIPPILLIQLVMTRMAFSFSTQGNRDPNRFGAWYQVVFALVVPICVGGWVFASLILQILFGTGFSNAVWVLRILMIYLVIETIDATMSVTLQAAHRQREDVVRLAFNPLTNILLNLALLPTLGIVGAAIGRVGGVCVSATLRNLLITRDLTEVRWLRYALKPAVVSGGVGLACYLLRDMGRPIWWLLLYPAATFVLLVMSSSLSLAAIKDIMSFPSK